LTHNGVFPDAEAIAYVYVMNPQVIATSFRPGLSILAPVVKGGAEVQRALRGGSLAKLTLDKARKERFQATVQSLQELSRRLGELGANRFHDAESRKALTDVVADSVGKLDDFRRVIRGRTWPIGPDLLLQIDGDATVLNSILDATLKQGNPPGAEDVARIRMINEDLSIKVGVFKQQKGPGGLPPRWPEVKVVVSLVSRDRKSDLATLLVYYTPEALAGNLVYEGSFDGLGSPTSGLLGEADYLIWAAEATDPRPVSERKKLMVRRRDGAGEQDTSLSVP
jgi:hypothetical protein